MFTFYPWIAGEAWIHEPHSCYWCPGAKAPGQHPQHQLNINCIGWALVAACVDGGSGGVIITRTSWVFFDWVFYSCRQSILSVWTILVIYDFVVTGFGKNFTIPGPGVCYIRVGLNLLKLTEFIAQVFAKYYAKSSQGFRGISFLVTKSEPRHSRAILV